MHWEEKKKLSERETKLGVAKSVIWYIVKKECAGQILTDLTAHDRVGQIRFCQKTFKRLPGGG